jgi:hypothetical protein
VALAVTQEIRDAVAKRPASAFRTPTKAARFSAYSMGTGLRRLGIVAEIEGSLIVQPPGRRGSKYHCGHGMRAMLRALSSPCAGLAGFNAAPFCG